MQHFLGRLTQELFLFLMWVEVGLVKTVHLEQARQLLKSKLTHMLYHYTGTDSFQRDLVFREELCHQMCVLFSVHLSIRSKVADTEKQNKRCTDLYV